MTTQKIIDDMRSHTITSMQAAADRLEELQFSLDEIRIKADRLIYEFDNYMQQLEVALYQRDEARNERDFWKNDINKVAEQRDEACAEVERLKQGMDAVRGIAREALE